MEPKGSIPSFNGLGERAGNAATEEIVMAVRTRCTDLGLDVNVDTTRIASTSQLISKLSGMTVQWSKPIVGKNAFSHSGGIHQDGILKDARTYEIMAPKSVGLTAADRRLHVGKLSGRAALAAQLHELGYNLEIEPLGRAFDMAKLLLGKKKALEELDLRYIAETAISTSTSSGTTAKPVPS
jgi:2-isopropylmalate synthase